MRTLSLAKKFEKTSLFYKSETEKIELVARPVPPPPKVKLRPPMYGLDPFELTPGATVPLERFPVEKAAIGGNTRYDHQHICISSSEGKLGGLKPIVCFSKLLLLNIDSSCPDFEIRHYGICY